MSHHPSIHPPLLARFGAALLAVAIACLVRALMGPIVGYRFQFLVFFPAILLSAWYGGFWPGLLSTLLSASFLLVLWTDPVGMISVAHPTDSLAILLFIGIGIAIAAAHESLHRQQAAQRAARVEAERTALLAQRAEHEAAAANRAKDEFLSALSHELRTPLTAILGWTSILRSRELDAATTARALEAIERNSLAQARLIEDIFDVSSVITGKLRLDVRPIDPAALVRSTLELMTPAVEAKGLALGAIIAPDLGIVRADPDRFQQILWNLLFNAVKFTPPGGRISVEISREKLQLWIRVEDTGQGIIPEFLPHVFERFRMADPTSTRQHRGLGLGLALVKHLVEMHGGSATAESKGAGQGATFTVILPVQPVSAAEEASLLAAAEPADPPRTAALEGVQVLVVDDDPDVRDLVASILEERGAKVAVVASAVEALGVLERRPFDVLVSDIAMPGEDGYSLLRRATALLAKQKRSMSAVALTAYAGSEDVKRAYRAGYVVHVAKPVVADRLVQVVARLAMSAARGG
jgi:signal transduction histidine kinase/ActR/RegA family two-component response regulator